MPAQDIYHDAVLRALTADGWMITHDPLSLSYGGRDLYVGLGAERTTIAAERDGQKIAIEIKSFLGSSPVRDLEEADRKSTRLNSSHSQISYAVLCLKQKKTQNGT